MNQNNYQIRTMSPGDFNLAIEWAAGEGWNPGMNDASCFYTADPAGFFVGLLDDEPIATISAVKYGTSFGFIGFYIVKPEFRGQGYGIKIWNMAMHCMGDRNVGLDGVLDQQDNYRKSGFIFAYRNIRFEGITGYALPSDTSATKLSSIPFEMVERYDAQFFPENRSGFLEQWISQPDSVALGILHDDTLSACGVIRPCRSGYKVGPLYAASAELAQQMYSSLTASVEPGQPVFLDVPELNRAAISLAQSLGMTKVFETARMYTGKFPHLPMEQYFGVTSFELG